MIGWITIKSVHKVPRVPEVAEFSYLVLRSKSGVQYKVSWEQSHVSSRIDEQGYLEVSFILSRSKEFFPTLGRAGEGKFDNMQITSTFLKESTFIDLLDIVCLVSNPELGEESLRVYGSTLKDALDRTPSSSDAAEIYGLQVIDTYPTVVEISDEGSVYTYLYHGSTPVTPKFVESDQVPV